MGIGGPGIDQLAGTVLQHVQTAAIAADGDGRVGVFNPAAARVLGVDGDAVLGRDLEDLTRGDPAVAALAGVLRETGAPESPSPAARSRWTGAAGSRRWATAPRCSRGGATARVLRRPHRRPRRGTARGRGPAVRGGRPHRQRYGARAQVAARHRGALRQPDAADARRGSAAVERLDVIKDQTRLCLDRIGCDHALDQSGHRQAPGARRSHRSCPLLRDVVSDLRRRHEGAADHTAGACGDSRVALAENDLRSVVTNLIVNALEAPAAGRASPSRRAPTRTRSRSTWPTAAPGYPRATCSRPSTRPSRAARG